MENLWEKHMWGGPVGCHFKEIEKLHFMTFLILKVKEDNNNEKNMTFSLSSLLWSCYMSLVFGHWLSLLGYVNLSLLTVRRNWTSSSPSPGSDIISKLAGSCKWSGMKWRSTATDSKFAYTVRPLKVGAAIRQVPRYEGKHGGRSRWRERFFFF